VARRAARRPRARAFLARRTSERRRGRRALAFQPLHARLQPRHLGPQGFGLLAQRFDQGRLAQNDANERLGLAA
jgi:hypothetical protein